MIDNRDVDLNMRYLADTLAEAIRVGFRDLGDRIAQGNAVDGTENLAIPLMKAADGLMEVARALEQRE